MIHEGFPKLGSEYTGFLHRHPSRNGFPMAHHVVVDLEDWLIARQNKGSSEQQTDNSRYESAMAVYVEYCEAAAPEFKKTFDNWLRDRLHSPKAANVS